MHLFNVGHPHMLPTVRLPAQWGASFVPRKRKAVADVTPADQPSPCDSDFESIAQPLPPTQLAQLSNPQPNCFTASQDTTENRILRAATDPRHAPEIPGELDLSQLLAGISYRLTMEGKAGGTQGGTNPRPRVPIVSRVYEETYMREPYKGERGCVSGAMCECNFIDPSNPFTGVEFVPYGVEPDPHPAFCVLCSRKITQKLFYDIILTGRQAVGVIQRYGNIVNMPGEYARECALICPTNGPMQCMPVPIMAHQRNKYEVHTHNGVRCIRQLRVGFEDFQRPSTEEQR